MGGMGGVAGMAPAAETFSGADADADADADGEDASRCVMRRTGATKL